METNDAGTGRGKAKRTPPDVTRKKGRKRDWTGAFLTAFKQIGILGPAATHAGVSRWAVRKRVIRDPAFAQRYNEAMEESTERLEAVAFARASRTEEPSDILLMFLLKGRKPNVYRDNWRVEHAAAEGSAVPVMATPGTVILLPRDGFEEAAAKYHANSPTSAGRPTTDAGPGGPGHSAE